MKFKIDENLPAECALIFREAGFEAATVAEQKLSGADDSVLFERCRAESRVLVTLDLDFANVQSLSSRISFWDCSRQVKLPGQGHAHLDLEAHPPGPDPAVAGAATLDRRAGPHPLSRSLTGRASRASI